MATETRPDHDRTERVVERPASAAANVNASTAPATTAARPMVWSVTRVVVLLFTVLEVILLLRFILKLAGANATQALVAGLYRVTEPLVRPFQGIFPEPSAPPVVDVAALLAVVFLFLIAALIVALVRAITGERRLA